MWPHGGRRTTATAVIDRCVKSHCVGKLVLWSYSSYFAATAAMHLSPMMLLPGRCGTMTNLAWRLPRWWLRCWQWCSSSPRQKGIVHCLVQNLPIPTYDTTRNQPTTSLIRPNLHHGNNDISAKYKVTSGGHWSTAWQDHDAPWVTISY